MFSLGSFAKRPVDAWKLELGFSHAGAPDSEGQQQQVLTWTASEGEAAVLGLLHTALASPELIQEHVRVQLSTAQPLLGVVAAAGYGGVRLSLSVAACRASLTALDLQRTSGGGTLPTSLALALWSALEAGAVTRLRCSDAGAVAALGDARVLGRFTALRVLNLSHAGLTALPPAVGKLSELQELRVVGNSLRILPPEVGCLTKLRVLAADSNQLTILPGELRQCNLMEELTLQHNRLTSVLLSFASLRNLSILHLYDNPLEFLPEISPCTSLTHLTVANLRVTAYQGFTHFKVEVLPPPAGGSSSAIASLSLWDSKPSDKLRPIFALMLRRSSGHHPLLAGALRVLAEEDPKNREAMARQENGLQQLVLMALSDSRVVVEETCRTLSLLAQHSPALADAVVDNDVTALLRLLPSADEPRQLASLQLLAAIAQSSQAAADRLATPPLLASLQQLVGEPAGAGGAEGGGARSATSGSCGGAGGGRAGGMSAPPGEAVRTAALKALGNLAFGGEVRVRLAGNAPLMARLSALALSKDEPARVQVAALRALAVLGENDLVRGAVGRPPISGRGLRILSMDGGGMKGMATVRLLREMERHTGKRIHELFDLIVGTSTGGLLAVAIGLRKLGLDDCEHIYKVLGRRVFSRIVASKDAKEESWMESFYRTFRDKTSHVRAVVVGYKHDAAVYEALLREYCDFSAEGLIGDTLIDTSALNCPAVALVSTLSSVTPAPPYVFRTYQLPPGSETQAAAIGAHNGSCRHPVWQAVRASSAASFYLEDFSCGGDKFQDGAVTANNPSIIALQEARLLWPDHPVDVMVSLGVGQAPPTRRGTGLSSFMETGSILIESSTDVQRAEEALATLMPLVPGVKYFRFRACDPRCSMELDEIDPKRWAALEAATDNYVAQPETQAQFAEVAAVLAQAQAAAESAAPPGAGVQLGARKRLVVLRCPRLGGLQQAGLDDAVATSLALLPACAAAINLQQLAAPAAGCSTEQRNAEALLPAAGAPAAAAAAALAAPAAAPSSPPRPGAPSVPAHGAAQPQEGAAAEEADSVEEEAGGLSAYLTSWFSPTKAPLARPALPASPAAPAGAGLASAGTSGGAPVAAQQQKQHQDKFQHAWQQQQQQQRPWQQPAAKPSIGGSAPAPAPAVAPAAPLPPSAAAVGCGISVDGISVDGVSVCSAGGVLAQLEARLSSVLPSVGVIHLGLPLHSTAQRGSSSGDGSSDGGLVLGWRQQLHVVAEPSAQASALLGAAGLDPATARLADAFAASPQLELSDGCVASALSSQMQWTEGGRLTALLLSLASPSALLPAARVRALGWLLRGRLVVAAAVLPPALVAALLAAGARGVVCGVRGGGTERGGGAARADGAHGAWAAGPAAAPNCCAFFDAFYDSLLGGGSAAAALAAAEARVPPLAAAFALHTPVPAG